MAETSILRIKVDASGAVTGFRQFEDSSKRANRAARDTDGGIQGLRNQFTALKGAIAGAGVAAFVRQMAMAQQASERMSNALRAATGSSSAAAKELDFVREQASRLGLDFASSAQEFAKFSAAAKGTSLAGNDVREIFIAVSEASTVLGLSSEQSAGALNALQQMISKGTVAAEELRGQLGERIPGAFNLAANAMGVTTMELGKMLEQGQVLASDLLPKLAKEMREAFAGGVETGAKSLTAEINRVKTAFFDLLVGLAKDADLTGIARGVGEVIKGLRDLSVEGGVVSETFKGTGMVVKDLTTILGGLLSVLGKVNPALGESATRMQRFNEKVMEGAKTAASPLLTFFMLWKTGKTAINDVAAALTDLGDEWGTRNIVEASAAAAAFRKEFAALPADTAGANAALDEIAKSVNKYHAGMKKRGEAWEDEMKAMDAVFDLKERLEDEARALKVFGKVLEETGGDFDGAKDYADAYLDVIKAGLDPLRGMGKALYEQGKAIKDQERRFEAAEDAAKDLQDAREEMARNDAKFAKETIKTLDDLAKAEQELASANAKRFAASLTGTQILKKQLEAEMALAKAALDGKDALLAVMRELEIQAAIDAQIAPQDQGTEQFRLLEEQIRASVGALFDFNQETEKFFKKWNGVADVFRSVDFGTPELNKAGDAVADLIDAFAVLAKAGKASSEQIASAWAAGLQTIQAVLEATGSFQTGNGGGFGGSSEGNYAAEGQMIGAVIGGIIGAFAGMPQVGMAIGGAAGGMIGGFVKKGADEALAKLTIDTSGIDIAVRKAEGGLRSSITDLGVAISDALNNMLDAIGGEIGPGGLPAVGMKIRDGVITVIIEGVTAKFKEMDDAISFAVTELLKSGDILGLDEMVAEALKNTHAGSLEALASDLDKVMKVLAFGLTNSQIQIQGFTNELDGLRNTMGRLLSSSDQLNRALANINAEEIRRWQSSRDAITGEKRSKAEQLQMLKLDATMWNAEKSLRVAELTMKRNAIQTEMELIKAGATLDQQQSLAHATYLEGKAIRYRMEMQVDRDHVGAMTQILEFQNRVLLADLKIQNEYVKGRANLVEQDVDTSKWHLEALGTLNQAALEQLQIMFDSIGQMIDALVAMPNIDVPNLHLPNIPGIGDGFGGGESDADRAAREAQEEAERIAAEIAQVYEALRQFVNSTTGWQGRLMSLHDEMERLQELANGDARALENINAMYEEQIRLLEQEALGSLGIASVEITNQFRDMADTLKFLKDRGAITEAQMRELGDSMFLGLADGLMQYVEDEEVRRQLAELRFQMEIANYRLQFALLREMNLLTQEQIDLVQYLLDNVVLPGEPPPPPPEPGGGGGGGGGGLRDEMERALIRALDRLRGALESYEAFQREIEMGPLSGATLQQQTANAAAQYQDLLARAQAGDIDAIEQLPDMARQYLELAGQYMDPSSSGYQALLAAIQGDMSGIQGGIEGILENAPDVNAGVEIRLDNIADILEQALIWWQVVLGPWNPYGTTGAPQSPQGMGPGLGNFASGDSLRIQSPQLDSLSQDLRGLRQEMASVRMEVSKQTARIDEAQFRSNRNPKAVVYGGQGVSYASESVA